MSSPSHFQFSAVINVPTRYAVSMRHKLAIEPPILVAAVFLYLLYGVYLQFDHGLTYSSHELFSTGTGNTNTTNLKIWWLISRNS